MDTHGWSLRTLLTTDKPLYQPGQTIHIRALTLSGAEKKPLSEAEVIFEVEDAKGNKVFKVRKETDKFGISFADFVLASELNMGTYRIRAIAAGAKEEKTHDTPGHRPESEGLYGHGVAHPER